jgi:hypothetical protein
VSAVVKFTAEADLCAAFIAWIARVHPDVRCYAEWAGWDILLVYPEGWQVGVQAKLRLNAEVVLQAAPDRWHDGQRGPDFRAVLVPDAKGWAEVAHRLGLVVFKPWERTECVSHSPLRYEARCDFMPGLRDGWRTGEFNLPDVETFCDWSPEKRHELPPCETDAIAGSPCPVTLTPWKLGALDVLAELSVVGTITAKRIRELGVNPARWTQCGWVMPGEKRGDWTRGAKCPPFDQQHPTAYAAALAKAQERRCA